MTTKEILEKMSQVVEQAAEEGIDPWNLPVKVILKRTYEEKSVTKEYNVLCLYCSMYNRIVITKADKPITLKEFLMCMSTKDEVNFWYVHEAFGMGGSYSAGNAHIMNIGLGVRGDKIIIVAEKWG